MTDGTLWEQRVRRAGHTAWAAIGVGVALWLAWRAAAPVLARVAPALATAVLVAAVLEPAASRLERVGVRRHLTVTALGVAILGAAVGGAAFLSPRAASVSSKIAERLPTLVEELQAGLDRWTERYPALSMVDVSSAVEAVSFSANEVFGAAGTLAYVVGSILAGIVAGAYLANDLPHLVERFGPAGGRRRRALAAAQRTFGRYLRGQIVLSLFVGVTTGIAAAILDVPRPMLIGSIAGITNLVPFLGPIVGGAVGATIALVVGQGPGQAALLVAAVIVIQQVESAVLSPRIQGSGLKVRPTVVILTLSLAGAIGGIPLMAVALPAVVSVREALRASGHLTGAKEDTGRSGVTEDTERDD